jgi:Tfp pilus assembly PilM family ATPase
MPRFNTVVGLDVGVHAVKVVRVVRQAERAVLAEAELFAAPAAPGELAAVVAGVLDRWGARRDPVVIGISGQATILSRLEVGRGGRRALEAAVGFIPA